MGGARRGRPRGPGRGVGRPLQRGEGGFAGRQIEAKVTVFNAITDGPVAEEALCNKPSPRTTRPSPRCMTGQFQENARPCYKQRQHADVRRHALPGGCRRLRGAGPLLLVAAAALLRRPGGRPGRRAHRAEGWFDRRHAGRDRHRLRAERARLRPAVRAPAGGGRRGGGLLQHHRPDRQPPPSTTTSSRPSSTSGRPGVDKVVAIGGSRLVSWFIDTSITQNFAPAYAADQLRRPRLQRLQLPRDDARGERHQRAPRLRHRGRPATPFPGQRRPSRSAPTSSPRAGLEFSVRTNIRTGLLFCDAVPPAARLPPPTSPR